MNGLLVNTGHELKIVLDDSSNTHIVNITGGPFVYRYRITEINLHWGNIDNQGSEHTIENTPFPAEVITTNIVSPFIYHNSDLHNKWQIDNTHYSLLSVIIFTNKMNSCLMG